MLLSLKYNSHIIIGTDSIFDYKYYDIENYKIEYDSVWDYYDISKNLIDFIASRDISFMLRVERLIRKI